MNINVNYLWNQLKSNEIMIQPLSLQNHKPLTKLKHCLNVPKTQHTTNSKTLFLVSSQIIPKMTIIKKKKTWKWFKIPKHLPQKKNCAKHWPIKFCRENLGRYPFWIWYCKFAKSMVQFRWLMAISNPTWAQHILITASIYIGNVDQITRMFPVGCSLVGFTCMDFKPPAFASKTFEIWYLDLLEVFMGVFVQFELLFAPTWCHKPAVQLVKVIFGFQGGCGWDKSPKEKRVIPPTQHLKMQQEWLLRHRKFHNWTTATVSWSAVSTETLNKLTQFQVCCFEKCFTYCSKSCHPNPSAQERTGKNQHRLCKEKDPPGKLANKGKPQHGKCQAKWFFLFVFETKK